MPSTILSSFSLPLLGFSVVMCITPGPNNLMLAASGVNFGFRRTLPHIFGIIIGMNLLFFVSASGLAPMILKFPALTLVLKIGGTIYLLYFSLKLVSWRSGSMPTEVSAPAKAVPLTFMSACLFQFLNPKGLVITLSTLSLFATKDDLYFASVCAVLCTFSCVCICTTMIWTGAGNLLQRGMKNLRGYRFINITLAMFTVATIAFVWV